MEKIISNLSKAAGPISGIVTLVGIGIMAICKVTEIEAFVCSRVGEADFDSESETEGNHKSEHSGRWNI